MCYSWQYFRAADKIIMVVMRWPKVILLRTSEQEVKDNCSEAAELRHSLFSPTSPGFDSRHSKEFNSFVVSEIRVCTALKC